jgi:predicted ribosome quality control (RQC) complex YloA/Tae2 family protein
MRTITKYIDSIRANIDFRVGENAKDNFDLIDDSEPTDIWFHIHTEPSSHVVVKVNSNYKKTDLQKIVIQGAALCKQFSRYRSAKNIRVMYTNIQNIKKEQKVGSVTVDTYKTIVI